jgi:predicted CXXCH cytochrome family protein
VNKLCLGCHANLAATSDPVKLPGEQKISRADYDAIPKIDLDRTQRIGHPWVTHPVAVLPDPLRAGEKMSCLSCHSPHSAAQENLIVAVKGPKKENVCDACHNANDQRAAAKSKSQTPPQTPPQPQQKPGAATQSGQKDKP